jgi:hypothetical protein
VPPYCAVNLAARHPISLRISAFQANNFIRPQPFLSPLNRRLLDTAQRDELERCIPLVVAWHSAANYPNLKNCLGHTVGG